MHALVPCTPYKFIHSFIHSYLLMFYHKCSRSAEACFIHVFSFALQHCDLATQCAGYIKGSFMLLLGAKIIMSISNDVSATAHALPRVFYVGMDVAIQRHF